MTRALRILQVITAFSDEAPAQSAAALAKYLDATEFEVTAVSLRAQHGRPSTTVAELERAGVRHLSMDMRGFLDVSAVARLSRLMREWRPDVVHSHAFRADLWSGLCARLTRAPLFVSTIRNHDWACFRTEQSFAVGRLAIAASKLATSTADALVAVSAGVRDHLVKEQRVAASKVHVIPNGFDFERLSVTPASPAATRAELALRPDDVVVGTLAVLKPRKGLRYLVEAAWKVLSVHPETRFVVAGEGPERPALEAEIARLGIGRSFRLLGHRPDPLAVLAALDVYVLPSLFEGLPRSLLEAMALAKPVVVTDIGGSREVVGHEASGLVVPPRDPSSLARAICRLIESSQLRRDYGAAGHRVAAERFDARTTARAHEALYRALLAGTRQPTATPVVHRAGAT